MQNKWKLAGRGIQWRWRFAVCAMWYRLHSSRERMRMSRCEKVKLHVSHSYWEPEIPKSLTKLAKFDTGPSRGEKELKQYRLRVDAHDTLKEQTDTHSGAEGLITLMRTRRFAASGRSRVKTGMVVLDEQNMMNTTIANKWIEAVYLTCTQSLRFRNKSRDSLTASRTTFATRMNRSGVA